MYVVVGGWFVVDVKPKTRRIQQKELLLHTFRYEPGRRAPISQLPILKLRESITYPRGPHYETVLYLSNNYISLQQRVFFNLEDMV